MDRSNVKLKHKVQLRKKVEEPEVGVPVVKPTSGSDGGDNGGKSKVWILIGVIAICAIGFWFFSKFSNNMNEPIMSEVVEPLKDSAPREATDEETKSVAFVEESNADVNNSVEQKQSTVTKETAPQIPVTPENTLTNSTVNTVNIPIDVDAEAMRVIRGDYGIGQERKDKLGIKYQTIQNRVNELKREGVF